MGEADIVTGTAFEVIWNGIPVRLKLSNGTGLVDPMMHIRIGDVVLTINSHHYDLAAAVVEFAFYWYGLPGSILEYFLKTLWRYSREWNCTEYLEHPQRGLKWALEQFRNRDYFLNSWATYEYQSKETLAVIDAIRRLSEAMAAEKKSDIWG